MEGVALAAMLPLWSYKSELLTPKPEAYHPFLQKVTILAKAINRNKPFCLADVAVRQRTGVELIRRLPL